MGKFDTLGSISNCVKYIRSQQDCVHSPHFVYLFKYILLWLDEFAL